MNDDDFQAVICLEGEISTAIDELLADEIGSRGLRCGEGNEYEMEESDSAWIFARKSDGERFEVEVDVTARKLPPKPGATDLDAPVHIEGQEELPLQVGGTP